MQLNPEGGFEMKIRFLGRTIENNKHRFNIDSFKNEKTLVGVSYRKKDMNLKDIKESFLYCIMPYSWLEKHFL